MEKTIQTSTEQEVKHAQIENIPAEQGSDTHRYEVIGSLSEALKNINNLLQTK